MEVQKPLAQLQSELEDIPSLKLGKPSGNKDKYLKKDYARALQRYHLITNYGSLKDIPRNLAFKLSFDGPQLALQYSKIKDDVRDMIWDSTEYRLTVKERGVRGTLVYSEKERFSLFPREVNEETYFYDNYSEKLFNGVFMDLYSDKLQVHPFALDVEIQLKNRDVLARLDNIGLIYENDVAACVLLLHMDHLQFEAVTEDLKDIFMLKILDVYFDKNLITSEPYHKRAEHFDSFVKLFTSCDIDFKIPEFCDDPVLKKAFHEGIMQQGLEGTVAVPLSAPCVLNLKRNKDGWIKIKQSIFPEIADPDILDDTVDVKVAEIIMNTEFGIISEVEAEMYDTQHDEFYSVGKIDLIPLSMRMAGDIKVGTYLEVNALKFGDNGELIRPIVENIRRDKGTENTYNNFL